MLTDEPERTASEKLRRVAVRIQLICVAIALLSIAGCIAGAAAGSQPIAFGAFIVFFSTWPLIGIVGLAKHVSVTKPRLIEVLSSVWLIVVLLGLTHSGIKRVAVLPEIIAAFYVWIIVGSILGSTIGWRTSFRLDETRPWPRFWHLVKGWLFVASVSCLAGGPLLVMRGTLEGQSIRTVGIATFVLGLVLIIAPINDIVRVRRRMIEKRSEDA